MLPDGKRIRHNNTIFQRVSSPHAKRHLTPSKRTKRASPYILHAHFVICAQNSCLVRYVIIVSRDKAHILVSPKTNNINMTSIDASTLYSIMKSRVDSLNTSLRQHQSALEHQQQQQQQQRECRDKHCRTWRQANSVIFRPITRCFFRQALSLCKTPRSSLRNKLTALD